MYEWLFVSVVSNKSGGMAVWSRREVHPIRVFRAQARADRSLSHYLTKLHELSLGFCTGLMEVEKGLV
jgi:hypothetical protein